LSEYLQNAIMERDNLVNTGKSSTGISSFLRETVDNIKGVDQEQAKRERLQKLDAKIAEATIYYFIDYLYSYKGDKMNLTKEVENSNDVSDQFSLEVAKEYEIFQIAKNIEMKDCLLAYADSH
ncbi:9271_t:CDS:2, partial [Racocetra fulgida]